MEWIRTVVDEHAAGVASSGAVIGACGCNGSPTCVLYAFMRAGSRHAGPRWSGSSPVLQTCDAPCAAKGSAVARSGQAACLVFLGEQGLSRR